MRFLLVSFFLLSCTVSDPVTPPGLVSPSTDSSNLRQQTPPPPDKKSDKSPSTAGSGAETRNNIFPYFINFDTLAYMHCPADSQPNDPVLFTFKFFSFSGLQLSGEFKNSVKKLNKKSKEQKLRSSPYVSSQVQLSLSKTGRPGQFAKASNSVIRQSLALNHGTVLRKLASSGVSKTLGHGKSLALSLPYPGKDVASLIDVLADRDMKLYLTYYNNGKTKTPIQSGEDAWFGSRFNIDFHQNGKYLTDVQEINLQDEEDAGNWVCPDYLRFVIHRSSQQTRAAYAEHQKWFAQEKLSIEGECRSRDNLYTDEQKAFLKSVLGPRNFGFGESKKAIRASDGGNSWQWTGRRCIYPIAARNSCYTAYRMEFDESASCSETDPKKACPSYFSICFKTAAAEDDSAPSVSDSDEG